VIPVALGSSTEANTMELTTTWNVHDRKHVDMARFGFASVEHFLKICQHALLHTHTDPFNGHLSRSAQVSLYQKGKTNLDFTQARDSEWQWHQLDHMPVCTSLQTDNHSSTPTLSFYRPDALPDA